MLLQAREPMCADRVAFWLKSIRCLLLLFMPLSNVLESPHDFPRILIYLGTQSFLKLLFTCSLLWNAVLRQRDSRQAIMELIEGAILFSDPDVSDYLQLGYARMYLPLLHVENDLFHMKITIKMSRSSHVAVSCLDTLLHLLPRNVQDVELTGPLEEDNYPENEFSPVYVPVVVRAIPQSCTCLLLDLAGLAMVNFIGEPLSYPPFCRQLEVMINCYAFNTSDWDHLLQDLPQHLSTLRIHLHNLTMRNLRDNFHRILHHLRNIQRDRYFQDWNPTIYVYGDDELRDSTLDFPAADNEHFFQFLGTRLSAMRSGALDIHFEYQLADGRRLRL